MKFFELFKSKHENLSKKVKKKKRTLAINKYLAYWGFTLLYMGSVIGAVAYKFQLYSPRAENSIKLNGYFLILIIITIYFGSKKTYDGMKKWADKPRTKWIDQIVAVIPITLLLITFLYVNLKITEVMYILQWIIIFRLVYAPIHVIYLHYKEEYDDYEGLIKKYIIESKYEEFKEIAKN